jgi:hypothetical protein
VLKSLKSLNLIYPNNKNNKNKNKKDNKVISKPLELFELAGKKHHFRKIDKELVSVVCLLIYMYVRIVSRP